MRRLAVLISMLVVALAATGVAVGATKGRKTSGTVWAGVTHVEGKNVFVSGDAKDKLLGRAAIVYITQASGGNQPGTLAVSAKKITLYLPKGTLVGTGSATQTTNPDGSATITNGKFNLTKGTGGLRGHTFKGTFAGTFKSGIYTFHYNGTYR